ncbi:MAG TPA: hypothetical protein DCF33_00170 [Saprospirales bacterium]|nr:hypothetical protein [Saprospirales bacterium]
MASAYFSNEKFQSINTLEPGEYEDCVFMDCPLTATDLSGLVFDQCRWLRCDLSTAIINGTAFRDNSFESCKLMGLHFEDANPFSLSFTFKDCLLQYASFFRLKIPGTAFLHCQMEEVNLEETDLRRAVFQDCNLLNAGFDYANLEETDFRTAHHFRIHPDRCKIQGARFAAGNLEGLLTHYKIKVEKP